MYNLILSNLRDKIIDELQDEYTISDEIPNEIIFENIKFFKNKLKKEKKFLNIKKYFPKNINFNDYLLIIDSISDMELFENIKSYFYQEFESGFMITDNSNHEEWYEEKKKKITIKNMHYWDRYRRYLLNMGWGNQRVNIIDKESIKTLILLYL